MKKLCILSAMIIALGGCAASQAPAGEADTVLTNGKIYTVDPQRPWVEAVAIKDGKFIFVGDAADAERFRSGKTKVIDLEGRMAMPGLNDLHVHPVEGFAVQMYQCVFPETYTPDDIARKVTDCVADNPDAEWIVGGQWETDFFLKHDIKSPREWLDKVSAGKAVFLRDSSFHNRWANSKALALAGIDKNTPDVDGGEIVRDAETGEPNGLLYERAADLVEAVIPGWTPKQYRRAAEETVKAANRFGLTGLKDAATSASQLRAYKEVERAGGLNVHVATSILVDPMFSKEKGLNIEAFNRLREENRGENLNTDFAKIVLDGVPSASRTAAMLENYTPVHPGDRGVNGLLIFSPDEMKALIAELDHDGVTVKTHAAGDRSVRVTLDAIEYAREQNGDSGLRHEIAHAGYVDPADIPRFVQLDAVAEVSPYIWFPSIKTESIVRAVGGERGEHYWPLKDMLEAGVNVVAGSDWPAGALPDMNPWIGIEGLVSRRNPWGAFPGVLWEEQAIPLEEVLKIYTKNGARALKLGNVSGSIETGKLADMIVLDRNLFETPVDDISDTQVDLTLFEGKIVYER